MTVSISEVEEFLMIDWVPGDLLVLSEGTGFCPIWDDWSPSSRGKIGTGEMVILIDLHKGDSPNHRFIWALTKFGVGWIRRKNLTRVS